MDIGASRRQVSSDEIVSLPFIFITKNFREIPQQSPVDKGSFNKDYKRVPNEITDPENEPEL